MQLQPRHGVHFHEGSKCPYAYGLGMHNYIQYFSQNVVFMMSDNNLVLRTLHFIAAYFIFITTLLCSDNSFFLTLLNIAIAS